MLSRREFLILGTGLGFGSFSLSAKAQAETGSHLLDTFPNLMAQVPDDILVPGKHSGFMIQSNYGELYNNFEIVFPSLVEGLAQAYRDNAQISTPWIGPLAPEYDFSCGISTEGKPDQIKKKAAHGSFFGAGESSDVSLIQSNFKDENLDTIHGHLELVIRHGERLALYYRESEGALLWTGPIYISPTGSSESQSHVGNPALIQGDFGVEGNFELICPHADGGIVHYTRFNDNKEKNLPWSSGRRFGESLEMVDAVAMLQSDYINSGESNGHLEVIARVGNQLFYFWQESKLPFDWYPISDPEPITDGLGITLKVAGIPSFIQSKDRDFHLVVPLVDGGMAHLRRQNDLENPVWKLESQFGTSIGKVESISLLQNKSASGTLELLARVNNSGNQFKHFFTDIESLNWQAGEELEETEGGDFSSKGQWKVPYSLEFGTVGIHAVLLHTGKVLFVGYALGKNNDNNITEIEKTTVSVLDPISGKQISALEGIEEYNKFCAGHAFFPDGRLVFASGNVEQNSTKSLHTFNPEGDSGTWTNFGEMNGKERWYPTCTTLPNGKIFIVGGTDEVYTTISQNFCSQDFRDSKYGKPGSFRQVNKTYEIFDGTMNGKGEAIPLNKLFDNCQNSMGLYGLYPFVFVLPNNQLFIHGNTYTYFLNISELETAPDNPPNVVQLKHQTKIKTSRTYPSQGSAVILPLLPEDNYQARIMLIGGGVSCEFKVANDTQSCLDFDDNKNKKGKPINANGNSPVVDSEGAGIISHCPNTIRRDGKEVNVRDDWPATNKCEILTINQNQKITETNTDNHPEWTEIESMENSRLMPDAVLLPDGTVFVSGGSSSGTADAARMPILEAEIYDPKNNIWSTVASMHVPRLYHAASVLLPSGEVICSGTDDQYNIPPFDHSEHRVEVFKPPYLFKGSRPKILSVPEQITYGDFFNVNTFDATSIKSVCLIALGATTHSFNMQQRYVGLEYSVTSNSQLELKAPPNSTIAPLGYYMLFLVNQNGVPSEAKFVNLKV